MKETAKALSLGIFIVTAIVIAIWLLLFLRPSVGDAGKELCVRFANVDRIRIGSRVTFAGKPVGEVTEISLIPDFREGRIDKFGDLYTYQLLLAVDSSVSVYCYDDIAFSTAGLLGERVIAIRPRGAPEGDPIASDISCEVLYAHSDDKMNEMIQKVSDLSTSFEGTLERVDRFFDENSANLHSAVASMSDLFERVNQIDLTTKVSQMAERASYLFSNLESPVDQIRTGKGVLGGLLYSEDFFCQISVTLARMELLLQDLNRFGILYQFNSRWQRERKAREGCP